jgi:hypothetical protein
MFSQFIYSSKKGDKKFKMPLRWRHLQKKCILEKISSMIFHSIPWSFNLRNIHRFWAFQHFLNSLNIEILIFGVHIVISWFSLQFADDIWCIRDFFQIIAIFRRSITSIAYKISLLLFSINKRKATFRKRVQRRNHCTKNLDNALSWKFWEKLKNFHY